MTLDQLGFCDRESEKAGSFAAAALHGLSKVQKILPCEFFYDARGSSLFEAITREPEYYPTRTEAAILAGSANEIARDTAHGSVLVEFGSGSSVKTEILLLALRDLAAYVPIDVSPSALESARARLVHRFPGLFVYCVMGDFRAELVLPANIENKTRLGFFPGSTIGNFTPLEAARLLRAFALNLGPRGRLIIGVDLRKDVSRLVAAYNDAAGVTAAFNLNLLTRANRELGADFNLAAFEHEAIFNTRMSRIEMHLVSTRRQSVSLLGRRFDFRPGETIHTENSHKYSVREFQDLARGAGWTHLFSVHELAAKA
ncbi:MAG: L-histidine N(alpha)-methyltransferase [Beijerinckiaceae bacterium]